MNIVFGIAADGDTYPDFPGMTDGALGSPIVGPAGLIECLETRLGLTGPRASDAARIATYASKARCALLSDQERFFASSFSKDPWATSRLLLDWRDQLVAGGWSFGAAKSGRLTDLAAIEWEGPALSRGISDRLRELLIELECKPGLDIESLLLLEELSDLPPQWRRLVEAVLACGVKVEQKPTSTPAKEGTDLRRVQQFLTDGNVSSLQGDGSFVCLQADTTLMAAEALAEWLAAGTEEDLNGTVIISPDGDTALLDKALSGCGMPMLGQSAASPWRGAFQVLPLALSIAWKPFDPKALLDLLLLPRPPIRRAAARKLARAITQEPGIGGERWLRAWNEIEEDLKTSLADQPNAKQVIATRLDRLREWTTGGLYDRAEGIPAQEVRTIAARVSEWAMETDGGRGDTLLLNAASAANAFAQAVELIGQDPLPALLIERIVEQVLADGGNNPDHVAEAGGLRCVRNPGAIWAAAQRVIWWNFKGPGETYPCLPWTNSELQELEAAGCEVERSASASRRITRAYANAAIMATERMILVRPALSEGEEAISHPLAHQLNPLTRPAAGKVQWRAEQLLENESTLLSGRILMRTSAERRPTPSARARWELPLDATTKLAARIESATSFERLIDCHLRWLLTDVIRLSQGSFAQIPGTDQLLGNLSHEIARRVLLPGKIARLEEIRENVQIAFDDLLGAIAAPLQQPEHAGELAAARNRVPLAIERLTQFLDSRGLEVVATEADREAEFANGLKVRSRIDLLVSSSDGRLGVIDLKWSKSDKRRRQELIDGRAFQLATYGAIADPNKTATPGAYYMLRQRRLLGEHGSLVADEKIDSPQSLSATWDNLVSTWRVWRDLAADGTAIACGIAMDAGEIPDGLEISGSEAPCKYCEFKTLCRVHLEET
jgi:ATP-dependent helicase/nuclease subunit B